ncbi:hypothetical protein [Prevotellamassilia timonensis]|uniref:hypothetical protein n=1 Tax=Prevotellamassilia timonensis TaxID=1852370 RepID=UPI001F282D77|nr:hypothetical protein [Prevotellamassilia timonensis]MCF2634182.1 hypothetical protein [Prevotellamassilia timonensis]
MSQKCLFLKSLVFRELAGFAEWALKKLKKRGKERKKEEERGKERKREEKRGRERKGEEERGKERKKEERSGRDRGRRTKRRKVVFLKHECS